jgi:hypothetical protein
LASGLIAEILEVVLLDLLVIGYHCNFTVLERGRRYYRLSDISEALSSVLRVSNNLPGLIRRACPPGCPSASLQQGFTGLSVFTCYVTIFVSSRLPCTSFEAGTVLCHHVSSMTSTGLC